jgi:DNA primase
MGFQYISYRGDQHQRCSSTISSLQNLLTRGLQANDTQRYGCGNPSNFVRMLDLFGRLRKAIKTKLLIFFHRFENQGAMREVFQAIIIVMIRTWGGAYLG